MKKFFRGESWVKTCRVSAAPPFYDGVLEARYPNNPTLRPIGRSVGLWPPRVSQRASGTSLPGFVHLSDSGVSPTR